jgi:hypothetical protein
MFGALIGPFIQKYIQPPPRPDIELPWIARGYAAKVNEALDSAWIACHVDGLEKGFVLGIAVATLVFLLVRQYGAGNAASKIIS